MEPKKAPFPDTLEIAVSDRGCGIAPEHLEKIFDELFSTKPVGEGTSLGSLNSRTGDHLRFVFLSVAQPPLQPNNQKLLLQQ